MAATMKDIARRTGLGLATISSYFNGGNVREKNRIKIEEAIEELHYEVNEVARGLKTNATKTIGVVIPELNNIFCAEIITGWRIFSEVMAMLRSCVTVVQIRNWSREAVEFLIRRRVDGIINSQVDETGAHLKRFQKTGRPIVLIDRRIQGIPCDSVLVDNQKAAEEAVELFIEKGHRNIGIIGGPEGIFTAEERLTGYCTALEKAGISIKNSLVYRGDYTIKGGVRGLEELVRNNPDMTAVFVTNYEMTMGAMIGVNELGIQVPGQLSMIGFDNLPFARACRPKLTIVSQPTDGIAREVARIMLERLEKREEGSEEPFMEKLQTEIMEGKSVCVLSR